MDDPRLNKILRNSEAKKAPVRNNEGTAPCVTHTIEGDPESPSSFSNLKFEFGNKITTTGMYANTCTENERRLLWGCDRNLLWLMSLTSYKSGYIS